MIKCKQCGVNPAVSQGYSYRGGGSSLCQDCLEESYKKFDKNPATLAEPSTPKAESIFFNEEKFLVVGFKVDKTLYLAKNGQWVEKPYACSFASKEEARKGMLASSGITNGLIINDSNEIIIRWKKG